METVPDTSNNPKDGCSTCEIASFTSEQDLFEHKFSLIHHANLDKEHKSAWYHLCELCRIKAGNLQNYADHLQGRRHKQELLMHRQKIAKLIVKEHRANREKVVKRSKKKAKGNSGDNKANGQSKSKKNSQANSGGAIQSSSQPKTKPTSKSKSKANGDSAAQASSQAKASHQLKVRPSRETKAKPSAQIKAKASAQSKVKASSKTKSEATKQTDTQTGDQKKAKKRKNQPAEVIQEVSGPIVQEVAPIEVVSNLPLEESEAPVLSATGGTKEKLPKAAPVPEAGGDIQSEPSASQVHPNISEEGSYLTNGWAMDNAHWHRPPPPNYRHLPGAWGAPLPTPPENYLRGSGNDGGYSWLPSSHGYGPPPPYGPSHFGPRFRYPPPPIQGPGGYFQVYDMNITRGRARPRGRASRWGPCSTEQQNPNHSRSTPSSAPNGTPMEAPSSHVQASSFAEDVPLVAATGCLFESSPTSKEKASPAVEKQRDVPATRTVGETPRKVKTPPSTLARAGGPMPSAPEKAPSATTNKAAQGASAAVHAKNIKKEVETGNAGKKIQPVPTPVRSHQIFVSSSEEETEESERARSSNKVSKDSSSDGRTKAKAKSRLPATPERSLPKELPGKSPRPTSTKDAYRKDVLDKLVNFPSSRKVQTQLSKWMRDLQKTSSSSTGIPGKTQSRVDMKLCPTRSLVARAEGGAIADFDYGSLMQQVDVGELPEEMLKSLMNALSSDAVTSDDTLSFASEDDECIILPPPPKVILSLDSDSESPEEEDGTGQDASSPCGNTVSNKDTPAIPEETAAEGPHRTKQVCRKERTPKRADTTAKSDSVINTKENSTVRAENEPDRVRRTAVRQKESDTEKQDGTASEEHTPAIQATKRVPQAKADSRREGGVRCTKKGVRRKGEQVEKADGIAEASSIAECATVPTGSQTQESLLPGSTTPIPVAPCFPNPVPSSRPSSAGEQTSLPKRTAPPSSSSSPRPSVASPLAESWPSPGLVEAKPEPGTIGGVPTHGGIATPPLRGLVDELVQLCHEEDRLRTQMSVVEQNIISVTLSLEDLRKKKDELVLRETQVRQKRLEKLQCLQGATSLPMGFSFPMNVTFPTTSEVLTSLAGGLDHFSLSVSSSTTATTPTMTGTNQSGTTFPGGLGSSAPDIIHHLLDSACNSSSQLLGNLGESTPSFMETSGISATSSTAPVSSSTSEGMAKKAVSKRKTTTGVATSPAARKRPRASKPDPEMDIEESRLDEIMSGQEIAAHEGAIVALKLYKHYVFSTSTDNTAKRHDLLDPSKCVVYQGSTKTVNSLEVQSGKRIPTLLYTTSLDCFLRCYDIETGECLHEHNMETPIICSVLCWGKIYLGLQTGYVAVFNLKSLKVQDSFYCSDKSVSRMAATTEGAQKLLCTVTYDGSITVRDPSTGLLFRCLDGMVQPPSCITINNGCVYTTSTNRTVHVHELRTGVLLKVFEVKSVATGVRFYKNLLLCCSFDGLICCYKVKDFSCQVLYYGAGKNMVMSMDACGPLIVTGNRKGKIEVIKLDVKSKLHTCEIRSCQLKFAREEDLVHHLKRDHIVVSGVKGSMTCPWTQCQMTFSGPNCNKDFEKHLMDHAYT